MYGGWRNASNENLIYFFFIALFSFAAETGSVLKMEARKKGRGKRGSSARNVIGKKDIFRQRRRSRWKQDERREGGRKKNFTTTVTMTGEKGTAGSLYKKKKWKKRSTWSDLGNKSRLVRLALSIQSAPVILYEPTPKWALRSDYGQCVVLPSFNQGSGTNNEADEILDLLELQDILRCTE